MKTVPDSKNSYDDLKRITDALYAGERSEYAHDVVGLLSDYGIEARQDDGKLDAVNISIPKSIEDSIVVGLRYIKSDSTTTEDHFLFQKNEDLRGYYKGAFELVAPEYKGTHKEQVHEHTEDLSPEEAAWVYMNKDLAKLKVLVVCYSKLLEEMDLDDQAYNQFFQLVLDSFSARIVTGVTRFFDRRSDSWSLYRLGADEASVNETKLHSDELVQLRHKQVAHIAEGHEQESNFLILSANGISIAESVIAEIHQFLSDIGRKEYAGRSYALTWVGVESSLDLMIEALKRQQ